MNKEESKKAFTKWYFEHLDDEQAKKISIALDRIIDKYGVNNEEDLIKNDEYVLQEITSDNPAVVTWDVVCEAIRYHLPSTAEWINDHRAEEFRLKPKNKN